MTNRSSHPGIVFHLVHGTGARHAPWTQPGSPFRQCLQDRLRAHHVDVEIEFATPQWSGQNRHSARLAGAEILRDHVRRAAGGGARQFMIGHSHGGSAVVLACREGLDSLAGKVDGIVCLSTPFLVFRRAPYLRWSYLACWATWWMVVLFAGLALMGDTLTANLASLPVPAAFAAFLFWCERRGYRDAEQMSAPTTLPVSTLLIRCPGDEASGALGASLIAERVMVVLTAKVAAVWAWMNHHRLLYLLGAVFAGLAVAIAMFASMALAGSLKPLVTPGIVLAALLGLVFVVPLLIGWPLRSLLYWSSYGFDVATRGIFLDVTAEPTPPGAWLVHTVLPQLSDGDRPAFAHSEPYHNDEAIDIIARWVRDHVVGAESGRPAR